MNVVSAIAEAANANNPRVAISDFIVCFLIWVCGQVK